MIKSLDPQRLGLVMRLLRKASGLSLREAAKVVNDRRRDEQPAFQHTALHRIERGLNVRLSTLIEILAVYGVSLAQFEAVYLEREGGVPLEGLLHSVDVLKAQMVALSKRATKATRPASDASKDPVP